MTSSAPLNTPARRRRAAVALFVLAVVSWISIVHGRQGQPSNTPARPGVPARDAAAGRKPEPVGTATIEGVVVNAGSGLPARRARVALSGSEGAPARHAVSDDQGRFLFAALPAGRYSLTATKPGHIAALYGQPRPGRPGTPIQLADGEKFAARLQLARGGVLTGTVLDEEGEAIPGTQVRALRYAMQRGQRTLEPAGAGATDDRGIYRIFGLQPGDYLIAATPRNAGDGPNADGLRVQMEALRQRVETATPREGAQAALASRLAALEAAIAALPDEPATGYAPVYYPGATALSQAAATALGAGEERTGLDFQLQRVPVARIEGVIANSTGQAVQNVQVTLSDLNQAAPGIGGQSTRAEPDGTFRFTNVPPGQYRIAVRAIVGEGRGRGGGRGLGLMRGRAGTVDDADPVRLWASVDVAVHGPDLTNVGLSLQHGVNASGRVVFQGTTLQPPADLTRMRVTLAPADPAAGRELASPVTGRVDATGRVSFTSITPGRYRLTAAGAPQGWMLESAAIDGQDLLDFPLEVKPGQALGSATITFGDRGSELTGTLVDGQGRPAPGYTLILYPADQRYWTPQSRRIRATRPATDGRFSFTGTPPGDYRLVPVEDVEPGAWFDPAFLQQLDAAALRVSIAEGEKKAQTVRITAQP